MGVEEASIRKIRGDGLSVKLQSNEQILEVTGDGCSITMTMNYGCVKIIGDGCRLRIDRNMGNVEYTGDGGRVLLGEKSNRENVKYTGDGGRVRFDGDSRTKNRKLKGALTKEKKEEPCKRLDEDRKGCEKGQDGRGLLREQMENLSNAKEEAKRDVRKEERRERSSTATIVTTFDYGEKIVKKWLADPGTVVRTLDGVSFVRIVPKRTKIVVK